MKKTIFYTTIMILVTTAMAVAGPIKDVHIRDTDDDRMAVNEDGSINVTNVATVAAVTEIASGTFRICNADYSTCVDVAGGTYPAMRVEIGDGYDLANVDGSGRLFIADGAGSLTVDAVDLDIRNLTAASDTVTITGTVATTQNVTTTFEYDNEAITTGAHTVTAPAASSSVVSIFNGGAGSLFVILCDDAACSGESTPAANVGIEIPTNTGKTWENVTVLAVDVFNEDSGTANVSYEWRR